MVELSILELGRVREGSDRRAALDGARDLAQHAEAWGYRRFWVAEHHNMPTVTTAATSLVIAHIAVGTKTIRVGAGGIMLPSHAPYVIAEQFGTLVLQPLPRVAEEAGAVWIFVLTWPAAVLMGTAGRPALS